MPGERRRPRLRIAAPALYQTGDSLPFCRFNVPLVIRPISLSVQRWELDVQRFALKRVFKASPESPGSRGQTTAATIRPNQNCYSERAATTATVALRSLALPMKYNETPPEPYTGKKL